MRHYSDLDLPTLEREAWARGDDVTVAIIDGIFDLEKEREDMEASTAEEVNEERQLREQAEADLAELRDKLADAEAEIETLQSRKPKQKRSTQRGALMQMARDLRRQAEQERRAA